MLFSSRSRARRDPLARMLSVAALLVAVLAVVDGGSGVSQAVPTAARKIPPITLTPKRYALLRLNANKKFPSAAIPKVAAAKSADTLAGASRDALTEGCRPTTVDLGSYCLDAATYQVPNADVGRNDFAYATRACVDQGGWLPSVAELVGAAAHVKLASTIDDNQTTASVDVDPSDGLKDQREMSSTLFTTAAGSSAAGSEGVTPGSKGDPKQSEPDPPPAPADPEPDTTQYMTVYDNANQGGLAGGEPLSRPERFRCAYARSQGANVPDASARGK